MNIRSLRRGLIIGINLAVISVLAITAWASYRDILHELDEVFDAQLAQTAKYIARFYSIPVPNIESPTLIPTSDYEDMGEDETSPESGPSGHKYESKIGFQIHSHENKLLAYTSQATDLHLENLPAGYHTITHNDLRWFVFSYYSSDKNIWVRTFQREDVRTELSGYLEKEQLWPLFLVWFPISVVIILIVFIVLKPVNKFSHALSNRALNNLSPIRINLPLELIPIKKAINQLLNQVREYADREKRFIADASHELRTPLSAIQVHAENILAANQLEEAKHAGHSIYDSVTRMSGLVDQLLILNRLDTMDDVGFEEADTRNLVTVAIDSFPLNLIEKYQWVVEVSRCQIWCNKALMVSAISNLISNAIKFSPIDSTIRIASKNLSGYLYLTVSDEGDGAPPDQLSRLGDRFYRLQNHSQVKGSGLGLSITKKIVELHQGTLTYRNGPKSGLEVELKIPTSTHFTSEGHPNSFPH